MHFSVIEDSSSSSLLRSVGERHWDSLSEVTDVSLLSAHEQEIKLVFSLSDFVAESCIRRPDIVSALFQYHLLDEPVVDYEAMLAEGLCSVEDETQLHQCLRRFRQLHMVRLAWLDLLNRKPIEDSLTQVSALANALICGAYHWLYDNHCKRYGTPQGDAGAQPLHILGMGKLGGNELNFSSDIDLIFTYPEIGETSGGRKPVEHQIFFTKLGQSLISALHKQTVDGQVFRVDMRLRPFGDSGPLVMHLSAFEDYYQSQGRDWERYAMVKARIINTEKHYADNIHQVLKPFVYRRYIDYGAIDALRKMKAMISQEVRRRGLSNNIKLGAGGIREVEFIVQSFQLIRGGREISLQQPDILKVLGEIEELHILTPEQVEALRTNYLYLRKVEHCLQQFNDQQIQVLPEDEINQQRLALIFNVKQYSDFLAQLDLCMNAIHQQFNVLIGGEEQDEESHQWPELLALWQTQLQGQDAASLLRQYCSEETALEVVRVTETFRNEVRNRRMGERGQVALDKLVPVVLGLVLTEHGQNPDVLLGRVFSVMLAVYRRTAYLDLLNENQGALEQLLKLCKSSSWIAEQISRFPILLDDLLNPVQLYQPPPVLEYEAELRQAMLRITEDDMELQMEALRQFKLSQQLRIAAADVTGVLPVMEVSDHLTFLAEAIIEQVVNLAWQQMVDKYGEPMGLESPNKNFAVIGYGKLGGIELGYGSDLDLVFLHGCDHNEVTNGKKAIESRQFYLKLAQRILHIFNAKTASGELYEVDMRLRPSGNAGLLVCHINGFLEYQQSEAWVWEHQALVRGRFIAGDDKLAQIFTDIRQQILCTERDSKTLPIEVKNMREKMRNHLSKGGPDVFDLKQDEGGVADIEFLVQYLALAHSHVLPELQEWSDNVRILESLAKAKILSEEQSQLLIDAYLLYRNSGHRLSLQKQPPLVDKAQYSSNREHIKHIWSLFLDS